MSRKRRELPIVENLEITGIAAEGKSLGRWNEMVVFVPFGAPGDVVDVQLTKKRHSFAEGKIVKMHTSSPMRVEPFCEHYGVCGGCKFQHIPYEEQLKYKQQQVEDALQRIAKVQLPAINPILGSANTCFYRNKLEFTFSNKSWLTREQLESDEQFDDRNALGFHIPNAFDKVLDINKCWLQDDVSNQIRNYIRLHAKQQGYSFFDLRANQA